MSAIADIRDSLEMILGRHHETYIASLRDWFGQKISKDDFDLDVLPFLHGEALDLHNKFMCLLLRQSINHVPNAHQNNTLVYKPLKKAYTRPSPPSLSSPKSCNSVSNNVGAKRIVQNKKRKLPVAFKRNDIGKQRLLEILKRVKPPEPKDGRFPDGFMKRFIRAHDRSKSLHPYMILNVTHVPTVLTKQLTRDPKLAKFFAPRQGPDEPYLTCNPSVQGKAFLTAWSKGINSIEQDAMDLVITSCHDHIKKMLTSLFKRRKAMQLQAESRDPNIDVFPNPQLKRGSYIEDMEPKPEPEPEGEDAELAIRIAPTDERDRIAALQATCSIPTKSSSLKAKTRPADLFEVIQADRSLIPCGSSRPMLKEKLFLLSSSFTQYDSGLDVGEESDDQDLLPICSY